MQLKINASCEFQLIPFLEQETINFQAHALEYIKSVSIPAEIKNNKDNNGTQ